MRMIKKMIACLLSACLVFGCISVHASSPSARNISVFRVDGENVSLSRGNARSTIPRDGQRLSDGSVLSTGVGSSVHIQMDTASILQMSASSQVAVSQSGSNLVLSVQSGSALVEVRDQGPGNTTETRIGNVGLTVRGTMYTMGLIHDFVSIVMLSGQGEVEGEPLHSGQIMHVFDEQKPGAEMLYYETGYYRLIVLCIDTLDILDLFTLVVMYERSEYLLEVGTLTPEMLEVLPDLIHDRRIELEEAMRAEVELDFPTVILPVPGDEEESEPEPSPTPRPTPEPVPENGETYQPPPPPPLLLQGSGTATDPYRIQTLAHMQQIFGEPCLNGWIDVYVELHADINNWTTVIGGTHPVVFRGSFNGRGHTINLDINMNSPNPALQSYAGLFAVVGGTVKDLTVTGSVESNHARVGGIAGSVETNGFLIDVHAGNLFVYSYNSHANVGGIVGVLMGSIEVASTNAHVEARAFGSVPNETQHLGGIVGRIEFGGLLEDVTIHQSTQITAIAIHEGAIAGTHLGVIVGPITNNLPSTHPFYTQLVGGGGGIMPTLAGLAFPFMLLLEEEDEEAGYPEDYPAKEDNEKDYPAKEDDDYPAKNEEDDEDDDYPAKNEDDEEDDDYPAKNKDEEEPYDDKYDDDPEDDYDNDDDYEEEYQDETEERYPDEDNEEYPYGTNEEYVPTFIEDDFELKGYYNYSLDCNKV